MLRMQGERRLFYFYSMDGQLKTMIDRTLPRYTEIRDKDVYFIATAAAGRRSMERTMDALRGFTDCLSGAVVKGEIYGEGVYQKGEVDKNFRKRSGGVRSRPGMYGHEP